MTKYILHGGETSRNTEDNKKYFFEMTKNKSNSVNILCVYFAREKNVWDKLFEQDKKAFLEASPTKVLNLTRAEDNIKIFKEQIYKNDVIYIRGGNTEILLAFLSKIDQFKELLEDKIVSGSSAGACALSKYYLTGSSCTNIGHGIGVLQIKTFVHFSDDKKNELYALEKYKENLPIYKIPEEKFIIINQ